MDVAHVHQTLLIYLIYPNIFPVLLMIKRETRKNLSRKLFTYLGLEEVLLRKAYIAFGVNSESESAVIKKHELKRFFFNTSTESSSPRLLEDLC